MYVKNVSKKTVYVETVDFQKNSPGLSMLMKIPGLARTKPFCNPIIKVKTVLGFSKQTRKNVRYLNKQWIPQYLRLGYLIY